MKNMTLKTLRTAAVSIVVAGLLLASAGCEEQRLRTANRTLGERLDRAMADNQQLQVEKDQLAKQVAQSNAKLAQRDKKIAGLEASNAKLTTGLKKLQSMYDELAAKPRTIVINPLPAELNKALRKFAADNPALASYDEKRGMVKFKSDLTFPPGSDIVNAQASATLAKLAKILNSAQAKKFAVYVAGHTDDIPIGRPATRRRHPTNWYLSAHRAVGVQRVLEKAGMAPARIAVMGFGEYHPVAANKPGKKGNQSNRRVEIWIVPAGAFLTTDQPVAQTK